jgi:hypothetical protein
MKVGGGMGIKMAISRQFSVASAIDYILLAALVLTIGWMQTILFCQEYLVGREEMNGSAPHKNRRRSGQ